MKRRATKLPAKIYVKTEWDQDESYFVADDDPENLAESGERIKVGIYGLLSVAYITTKTEVSKCWSMGVDNDTR